MQYYLMVSNGGLATWYGPFNYKQVIEQAEEAKTMNPLRKVSVLKVLGAVEEVTTPTYKYVPLTPGD